MTDTNGKRLFIARHGETIFNLAGRIRAATSTRRFRAPVSRKPTLWARRWRGISVRGQG